MRQAALFILLVLLCNFQQDRYTQERNLMVDEQIIARGIKDKSTINAMRKVPRHKFVPPGFENYAYGDFPLSIGHNQTISQPYIVAFMTEVVQLQSHYKVLEIGTGSGYQAAVLSEIVSKVYTIEIVEPLAMEAEKRLKDLGYNNVTVICGNGYKGYQEQAPYDAILATAAPEDIPPALIEQLKEGGKLVIPVGPVNHVQYLTLVEKKKDKYIQKKLMPVRFVPFTGDKK